MNSAEIFDREGYAIVKNFVPRDRISELWQYSLNLSGRAKVGDIQVAGTPMAYCDPEMQKLLIECLPKVEKVVGKKLFKTCSYWRMYKKGDILRIHKDRPACEISLSITLGYDEANEPWPLYIMNKNEEPIPAILEPGDALFYKGLEMHHWRGINKWGRQAQVFMHYVNAEGQYAHCKDDNGSVQ